MPREIDRDELSQAVRRLLAVVEDYRMLQDIHVACQEDICEIMGGDDFDPVCIRIADRHMLVESPDDGGVLVTPLHYVALEDS